MFFDIGANIGEWSSHNVHLTDKIIAVEASPNTFKKLQHNIQKNNKIICLNYAVCNNDNKDITFYECEHDTLSTVNVDWLNDPKSRFYNYRYTTTNVKSVTLDSLIKEYGKPDLIKIDVEGGEYSCLQSLTTKVPLLCFEWASELNDITFNCLDYLYKLGFTDFFIQYEDNYNFRPTTFISIDDVKNILNNCRPKQDWGMIWCK
jgi:FkbM family methyltransferase